MAWRQTFEATAYSSDWRSCGWEWGLALGPLPLYLPLCYGRRPSGTFAWPLVPQHRKQKAESKLDLMLGGAVLAAAAAAAEVARAALQGTLPAGFRAAAAVAASSRSRRFQRRVATAACVGAGVGITTCPLGRD